MTNLVNETLRLAKKTKLPKTELCKRAEVGTRWFYRFLNGDFKEPGANKIQRLHQVLTEVRP